jgi:hypothetical protein
VRLQNSPHYWSTVIIILFFMTWFWTEVSEYITRDTFRADVTDFIDSSEQFDQRDGDSIRAVIQAMNRRQELCEKRIAVVEQHVMSESEAH